MDNVEQIAADLWAFSLGFYERPGVAARLNALQDENGLEVNLALFCLYAGFRGHELSGDEMNALEGEALFGGREIVGPLRRARRALKPLEEGRPDLAMLRKKTKALELEAERAMQRSLAGRLVLNFKASSDENPARANLAACLARINVARPDELAGQIIGTGFNFPA